MSTVTVVSVKVERVRVGMTLMQLELVVEALKKHSPEGATLAQELDEAYVAGLEF